jgi:hypothetical protein
MSGSVNVPIVKAGDKAFIAVDTSTIPPDMWDIVVMKGLEAVLGARMSKVGAVTKLKGKELEDAQALALKIANENFAKMMAGTLKAKAKGKSSDGTPREVTTEARRQARQVVMNEIKRSGGKPSQYAAKDITGAADQLIASDPSYIEKARLALEERANITSAIDISTFIKADPKKVAKAAEAKANKPLSATQAGRVAPRRKPAQSQASAAVH